ncbi:MAG TPA: hypothetical protein EYH31_12785 [Anaerolineae bacterium]|nr:hypothetical protein [Anaerolineae bacterium]
MNHFYLDASALGKRYVVEVGTPLINHLFDTVPATRMTALIITLGEIISILVRRRNAGDISQRAFQQAMVEFRNEVVDAADFSLQAVSNDLVMASLPLIEQYALNATDALILCAALQVAELRRSEGDELVLVASDARLLRAAQGAGLLTWSPEEGTQVDLDALIGADDKEQGDKGTRKLRK